MQAKTRVPSGQPRSSGIEALSLSRARARVRCLCRRCVQVQLHRPSCLLRRDGGLIPFSMTLALLASLRGSLHTSSGKSSSRSSLLSQCHSWAGLGMLASSHSSLVLVPRVGGFGHEICFQDSHVGINEGAFGPATLRRERTTFAIPPTSSGPLPL